MRLNRLFATILAAATVAVPMFAASAQTPPGFAAHRDASGRLPGRAPGVFGQVTAVTGNTLTVTDQRSGTAYTVDASGAKITKDGQSGTVADLAVGDNVMIEGTVNGTSVTATAIRDGMAGRFGQSGPGDRSNNGQRPAVVGKITAVSGSTLTVAKDDNTVYTVDASKAKIDKNRVAVTVADLAVNDRVMVEGAVNGTAVTATAIHDGRGWQLGKNEKPAVEGNGQPVIMGAVAAVNGSTITIKNNGATEYSVDASAAKITKDGPASTVAAIAVGDTVIVQGAVNGTTVTAASVNDQTVVKHEGVSSKTADGQAGNHGRANGLNKTAAPGFFGRVWGALAHFFGF